ncbi:SMC-Scp complex subunit ScpB [Terrihabitans sp. B22-R8]|uniref:SMC-Scp complex subunit ScpB n=1 Tax=Terrihabitans sp. B22-R8 TaxID=3425128 RepID=UPI00403C3FBD
MAEIGLHTLRGATASDAVNFEHVRMAEALLFAAAEPLDVPTIRDRLPEGADVPAVLTALGQHYAVRGVNLVIRDGRYAFRTAADLAPLLSRDAAETRKLSRAALETLAIIAYHQPVTRSEIEAVRGVSVAKGTLDVLLEAGWIRLRGRRKSPGRPVTFGTTPEFLDHFGLEMISDLPGMEELKAAGLLDARVKDGFDVPAPSDDSALQEDEEPIEPDALDFLTPLDEAITDKNG